MRKVILFLIILFIPFQQPTSEERTALEIIAEAGNKEGLVLESWQINMDEKLNRKKFEQLLNKLEINYNVTMINEHDKLKYVIRENNPHSTFHHTFYAIVPKNNRDDVTLQLVISGQKWDEETKNNYYMLTNLLKNDYDLIFGRNFTCLKFAKDDIMRDGLIYENLWEHLQVSQINEHKDNINHSTYVAEYYGYSNLLPDGINVANEKVNFQMVVKESRGNNTQIIIGTPIVINEY